MTSDEVKMEERQFRSWLPFPIGHRQHERSLRRPERQEFLGQMVPVVQVEIPPDDVWICDWCNADIEVVHEDGSSDWIPMFQSSALCRDCMEKTLTADELIQWERNPEVGLWSMSACGCPPCRFAVQMMLMENGVGS